MFCVSVLACASEKKGMAVQSTRSSWLADSLPHAGRNDAACALRDAPFLSKKYRT